jgi:hypothetical protein
MLANCAAAKALRVWENRAQGKWLLPFAQPHLISPAKVFPNSNAAGDPFFTGRISGSRSTVDDELNVFGKVSGHFSHDVAPEQLDH